MRKWISYSFIWLAAILLIGHSLVPHVHQYSKVLTVDARNCHPEASYGFLGKLFSVDIGGEGHLEEYLQLKSGSIKFSKPAYKAECNTFSVFCPLAIEQAPKDSLLQNKPPERSKEALSYYFSLDHSLRAPPLG